MCNPCKGWSSFTSNAIALGCGLGCFTNKHSIHFNLLRRREFFFLSTSHTISNSKIVKEVWPKFWSIFFCYSCIHALKNHFISIDILFYCAFDHEAKGFAKIKPCSQSLLYNYLARTPSQLLQSLWYHCQARTPLQMQGCQVPKFLWYRCQAPTPPQIKACQRTQVLQSLKYHCQARTPFQVKSCKKLKFPNPSSIVIKLSHPCKSRVVKEVKFPNPTGIVVKLVHDVKLRVVKELKFPNPFGIVVKLSHPCNQTLDLFASWENCGDVG